MEETKITYVLPEDLVNKLLKYLQTKPFVEVYQILNPLLHELQNQPKADEVEETKE